MQHQRIATLAGRSTPVNDEAPSSGGTEGLMSFDGKQKHSTQQYVPQQSGTSNQKAASTQIALLALAGHAVHHLADGGYLVCKYGYTHHAKDFDALLAFSKRLGVAR